MFIQTDRVRRNGKTYEYTRLLESYRRKPDGMSVKRVVANITHWSPLEIANLSTALEASSNGQTVAAVTKVSSPLPAKPTNNLRFLDIAVFLQLWRDWGLDTLLEDLIPTGDNLIPPADVLATLVLHRCIAPNSKLHATRWFPKTALPELLNICPKTFHNTRLHRVLHSLEQATPTLMKRLSAKYLDQDGAFSALFIDVTDACFTGKGPSAAKYGRTKKDNIQRMIGILLLCNQNGYPLRWEVLEGNQAEAPAMVEQLRAISRLSWAKNVPTVVDRALGKTAYLRELLGSGVPFLTALVRPEFPAFTSEIPYQSIAECRLVGSESRQIAALVECISEQGFQRAADNLYFRDLGVIRAKDQTTDDDLPDDPMTLATRAMGFARQIKLAAETGQAASKAEAGRLLGLTKGPTW